MDDKKKRKRSDSSSSVSSQMSSADDPSVVSSESSRSEQTPSPDKKRSSQKTGSESTPPSVLSLRSDRSKFKPPDFSPETPQSSQKTGSESTASSVLSLRSDRSKFKPPDFSPETPQSCSGCGEVSEVPIQLTCGHWSCKQCVSSEQDQSGSPANPRCRECGKKFRNIPVHGEDPGEDIGGSQLLKAKMNLKEEMRSKFTSLSEGICDQWSSLNSIYTKLLITESKGPCPEHESRRLERKLIRRSSSKSFIKLNDIFRPSSGQEKPHRTVLTKGVAGIGKSFAVQKFVLDWAEGKASEDVEFVFSLAFRELHLISGDKSLLELLSEFYPSLRDLGDSVDFAATKTIVILDGLDESRLQLDFETVKTVTSVSEVTSVGNLLVNLIQGNLLPDAHLWITSRPAAANQIPDNCVQLVTEIRGFSDPQKVEYFKKRFSQDLGLANRITSHIQSSQSLNIMCQIPIFCWISAVLFQEVFEGHEDAKIPQTLTEMMANYLFAQTKRRSRKYDKKTKESVERLLKTHREFLLKLGKLAFSHLLKNNLIFYEEDLKGCGIDIQEATIYSGFCTTVLREEEIFSQKEVFSFVHLTIQEFFAALYVYDCFTNKNPTEIGSFLDLKDEDHALVDLLKMTVDKVLEKKNGHLDFFLRFLLGLLVESNRRVLQGLLTPPDPSQDTDKKILTYLKSLRRKGLSPDSCINLFQTMVEMRDHKVKDEIQEYLKLSDRSKAELTPLHCSALAYMLQVSKDHLDVLDLKSYNTSEEGRRRLIPAVRSSKKALLADCKVNEEWVEHLVFSLMFPSSPLRDLDLSNNDLKDSGVKLFCDGLSSQCCRLQTLSLSGCLITETGCRHLVSALKSNPSHLKELDLSYNHPGDTGKKLLNELVEDPQYKLNKVKFEHDGVEREKPGFKKYACKLTLDPNTAHKNLLLSDGNRKAAWVEDKQPYPDHPERFDLCQQVLCEQGLKERCYFEVQVVDPFCIGLTYRSIGRKGDGNDCKLGCNNKSWCLICSDEGCYVLHLNKRVDVSSHCSRSSRVGVYLDCKAGTLSFYRVSSDSQTRLHTFKENFSDDLYPAVGVHTHSSAMFCQPT